jgi:hypothetical protein
MRKHLICYVKGLYSTLPIMTHVRDCSVVKYPERIHFNIPLHETLVNKKPVVVVKDGSIEIIFSTDEPNELLQ